MDSLTQIVLGAAVGEAVLGNKIGNKAIWYGAIGGTIPDLDVLAQYVTDTVTALEIHRGFTHSFVFSVIMGFVLGLLVSRWEKGVGWRQWSWFWFMCLVTHPLLDAHTTWGTQFFWPLEYRLAYKNIFVIDPLYTLPFLICLISAMRYKRDNPKRRTWNYRGLIISTGYLMLTLLLKGVAYTQFTDALEEQQIIYQALETKPTPLNSIIWTAHVETKDAYLIANYSFFDSKPIRFYSHPKNHEALGVLSSNDKIERLKEISEGWYVIRKKDNELFFNDLRFGQLSLDPSNTDYVFSYKLETVGDELAVVENRKRPESASQLLTELWGRVWGN